MGNLHKIDVADMVDHLTTKSKVISIFNNTVEESGVKNLLPEPQINLLTLNLSLYLKVRAFSMAKDITKQNNSKLDSQRVSRNQ